MLVTEYAGLVRIKLLFKGLPEKKIGIKAVFLVSTRNHNQ